MASSDGPRGLHADALVGVIKSLNECRLDASLTCKDLIVLEEVLRYEDKEANRLLVEDGRLLDMISDCLQVAHSPLIPAVLVWLGRWLISDVESFDHSLGKMSRLSYFLTERDRYSVEIAWAWRDAKRMSTLCSALLEVASHDLCLDTTFWLYRILSSVLLEAPASRVTPHVILLLITKAEKIKFILSDSLSRCGIDVFADLSLGITSLGLGLEFVDLLNLHSHFDLHIEVMAGHRCSCSFCELLRRIRKAARCRDEFGVEASFALYEGLCDGLKKGGIELQLRQALTNLFGTEVWDKNVDEALCKLVQVLRLLRLLPAGLASTWCPATSILLPWLKTVTQEWNIARGGCSTGVRQCLLLFCEAGLYTVDSDIQSELRAILMRIAAATVNYFEHRRNDQFPVASLEIASLYAWLLIASGVDGIEDQKDIRMQCVELLCEVCNNTDMSGMTDHWRKEIFAALVCCIGLLCGCREYFAEPDEIRRLTLVPRDTAGFLLPTARAMLSQYPALFPFKGCTYIKTLLLTSITRAEKAMAIRLCPV
eukprot:Blabericola_migrator_1__5886@NODE_297_length_10209_cov_136_062907_g244_i0_p2_GENE_NODE_297_length_10209_cov_136_062907_g244_i0NODE_297_length_10209_cov_136_062907_g244_i0_p2_ORF_typecomplete_len540_score69_69_NODE_297_length_10209_cov_136_062907_g244_i074839102